MKTLGLYVHIPFCKQKCIYCDFYSLPRSEDRMDRYTQALRTHMAALAPQSSGYTVDTVYFGGGTPSYLGARRLTALLDTIRAHYDLSPEAEITFEANPDSACDADALRALRQSGFNRISLGMQSANDEELRRLGRVHTAAQLADAVTAAREAGFDNLSLDLIYGLPGQTMDRWQKNLAAAAALQPEHLSCYGLKVEEGTPLFAMADSADLPDDEAQADFYLCTVDYLRKQGYGQYEISNFAKSGRESRHNLKYWKLEEYLGFGPGAHSDFGGVRFAWERDLNTYIQGVESGEPPRSERQAISPQERHDEWVMLGLRTVDGLDPAEYERRFSCPFAHFLPFLEQCRKAGYAADKDGRWHLTPEGFLLSNQIISGLLDT